MSTLMEPLQKTTDRKDQYQARMIATVEEYVGAFKTPCPIKILSAKYSRALQAHGGFPELLNELKAQGKIKIFLTRSGSKVVLPADSTIEVKDSVEL